MNTISNNLIRGLSQTLSIVLEFSTISFFVIRSLYIMRAILMSFTSKIIHKWPLINILGLYYIQIKT